ncbi:uncharacterized protein LOC126933071 [Macaca thibetana thibetana]|uniref:uncharacterized protein LOC126933071 n=1 Tax=Macaca thibetana thibetana TaxID=257877 RepID=UPI0021BCB18A|nr:uncharacterized protein LOC126933071 [Macaca thibetana thibetana]
MHLGPLRLPQGICRATPSRFNKRPAGGALPMQKARPCLPCRGLEKGSLKGSWGGRSPNKAGSGVGPRPRGPEALGQLGSPAGRRVQGLSPSAGLVGAGSSGFCCCEDSQGLVGEGLHNPGPRGSTGPAKAGRRLMGHEHPGVPAAGLAALVVAAVI